MSDQCRSCQAPVLWLQHATTGKRAPINTEPDPAGNIAVLDGTHYQVLGSSERQDALNEGWPLHLNHYVTCPYAAAWKKRGARA